MIPKRRYLYTYSKLDRSEKKSDEVDGTDELHGKDAGGISRFRTALPQVLASTAKNLILLELGMTIAFPTIVIPALHNVAGQLSLDDDQASWLGSLSFIFQPIGSILSGMILEPLGRKRSMIVVNIPQLTGWLLLYWADSVTLLYSAAIIMGMGVGFMEAPIITYVGEISQPHLRGVLTSYAGICAQLGFVLEFFLGTVTDWRTAAIASAVVPIITALAITQVPETPIWLLSRGRKEEAEKSLCWLRGWVTPSAVRKEFQQLVHYHEIGRQKLDRRKASRISETLSPEEEARIRAAAGVERHRGSQHFPVPIFPDKKEPEPDPELVLAVEMQGCCGPDRACTRRMEDFFSPSTMKPLLLVVTLFFFQHAAVVSGLRPYLVEVVRDFGMPIDAHWGTVVSAVIGVAGNVVCMILVPWTGKRALTLVSLAGCAASALLLGGYAFALLQEGEGTRLVGTWAPLALLITLSFCHGFGIGPVPWMMVSEVFPFRTRGLGSGVAAAMSYILGFVASKSFLWLQLNLGRSGVFWLYGVLSILGVILLGWKMPETEGKSLEEIENFYKRRRSLKKVLANVTTLTEGPILIGSKHRAPPEDETCLSAETLTSVETAVNKLSENSVSTQALGDGKNIANARASRKSVSAPSLVNDADSSHLHNSASIDTVDTTASVETLQTSVDTIPNTDSKHFKTSINVELSPPNNNINDKKDAGDCAL